MSFITKLIDTWAMTVTPLDGTFVLKPKDKYEDFCVSYMAHNSLQEERPQTHSVPTGGKEAVDAAKQGVTQGINKLKGLFGK